MSPRDYQRIGDENSWVAPDRPGSLFAKLLPDGREAVVYPLTFGRARISVCPFGADWIEANY